MFKFSFKKALIIFIILFKNVLEMNEKQWQPDKSSAPLIITIKQIDRFDIKDYFINLLAA